MKPWREVARPHRDIREGTFDESSFMVDFSSVIAGRGADEYQNAQTFAERTFLTKGLIDLLSAVVRKLEETRTDEGKAVIQLLTPFGGGKTHTLVALYHLFNKESKLPNDFLAPILQQSQAKVIPQARVVTFVGQEEDALKGKTPWGQIAEQLGRYDLVKDQDTKRIATGKKLLREVLGTEPTLILMDEILLYAIKAERFGDQLIAFFQELTETVNELPHCVLVYCVPENPQYGDKGIQTIRGINQVLARVKATYVPVKGLEVFEVIRRRLFEPLDNAAERELKQTAEDYWELYRKVSDDLPDETIETEYLERMQKAYPFHPQLIELLRERWGSFYDFQRTRGVLQILARVVADLYQREHKAPLIQIAHLNLANFQIREKLIEHAGSEYNAIIDTDIVNDKVQRIDDDLGSEYKPYCIASSLATAIFFGSFGGGERKGLNSAELCLALLRDELPPPIVRKVLSQLEDKLWYLHKDQDLYFFKNAPNIVRVISDREADVKEEDVKTEIEARLKRLAGSKKLKFYFPSEQGAIEDKGTFQIALLSGDYAFELPDTTEFAENLLNKHRNAGRVYRNTLLILAPDAEVQFAKNKCKRLLALRTVINSNLMEGWSKEVTRKIRQDEREEIGKLDELLLKAYCHLARAGANSSKCDWNDLGMLSKGIKTTLESRVLDYLKEEDILASKLDPKLLLNLFGQNDEVSFDDVYSLFLTLPEHPILEGRDVLWQAVLKGLSKGLFGLRVGPKLFFKTKAQDLPNFQEETKLIRAEVAEAELKPKVDLQSQSQEETMGNKGNAGQVTDQDRITFGGQGGSPSDDITIAAPRPPRPEPTLPHGDQVKHLTLRLRVSASNIAEFAMGILRPLTKDAELEVSIVAEANSSEGITRTTLNNIEESITQNKIEVLERREK